MVRRHGWGGTPPLDDAEARQRILDATRSCLDDQGEAIGIAEVARALGVSRQTVYRYFAGTEVLLAAAVMDSTGGFLDRAFARFPADDHRPEDTVVEAVVRVVLQLPKERYLRLMLTSGRVGMFAKSVTSPVAVRWARAVVDRIPVDWARHGVGDDGLDELTEHLARTIQSFLIDPGTPPRGRAELRAYFDRWLAPTVAALVERSSAG